MKYAKFVLAIVATVISGIVVSMTGDSYISNVEWVNIAISGVGACAVFAAPNVPGAMYTKSILAALTAALTLLTSFITDGVSTSEWLQIAVAVVGALGVYAVPNSQHEVRSAKGGRAHAVLALVACLLFTQNACNPPSRETLLKFQSAGQQLRQVMDVNASLPEQWLASQTINFEQYSLIKLAQLQFSKGVDIYNETFARIMNGELKLKVLAPIVADLIAKLRAFKTVTGNLAQTVLGSLELALRFAGTYFALRIAEARQAGYSDRQICKLVGLPYDRARFELLAAGV